MNYLKANKNEIEEEYAILKKEYAEIKSQNLSLNMARGKPCPEQLDLSNDILDPIGDFNFSGLDLRNYGCLEGLPGARKLMSHLLGCSPENVIVGGNSSLSLMHDVISNFFIKGSNGCIPWKDQKIKFLCPCPGYDRHFKMCEFFNIKMIPIRLTSDGLDMKSVNNFVENDESIKGIWCVPKYSNPDGYTYSDDTVKRFARLTPKAKDFRIYWDNAYTVHHLYEEKEKRDYIIEILEECEKAGNPDMVYKFASTSKITFPGSGIAALATSVNNVKDVIKHMKYQTISYDKVNELRHVRFFNNLSSVENQMRKHAEILRPKFEAVDKILNDELGDKNISHWTKPNGGYFVSFYSMKGLAKKIVSMCKELGVILTDAGAAYPYHKDPDDSNIRIAPSFPSLTDLKKAMEVFTHVVKICSIEKLLNNN